MGLDVEKLFSTSLRTYTPHRFAVIFLKINYGSMDQHCRNFILYHRLPDQTVDFASNSEDIRAKLEKQSATFRGDSIDHMEHFFLLFC